MERQYQLFRREPAQDHVIQDKGTQDKDTHGERLPEKSSQEDSAWAIAMNTEDRAGRTCLIVRYGSPGKLDQTQYLPTNNPDRDRLKAIQQQEAQGYRYIGQFGIHPGGCPYRQETNQALLSDDSALSWELTSPPGAAQYAGMIQRCFYDAARILEAEGLATLEEHWIQIQDWSLSMTTTTMEGINHLCTELGEGSGLINHTQGLVPVLFLRAATKRFPEVFTLTLAQSDGTLVPFDLSPGSTLLHWANQEQHDIRPLAEALGLLEARINLEAVAPAAPNYYF